MRNILKYILIDQQFEFDGERRDLIDSISKVKGVSIKEVNYGMLKIYPWISIGTVVPKSGYSSIDGINIKAEFVDDQTALTRIRLLTTVRPEHYIIAGIFVLFFLFGPLDKDTIYKVSGNWIIVHIWFQVVFRIQEELLLRKLVNRLKLIKM